MKYIIILLALSASLFAELNTIEFSFTQTSEFRTEPILFEQHTKMIATYDSKTKKGKLIRFQPFSSSEIFETYNVRVKIVENGIHLIEEKKNGSVILSMGMFAGEACFSYSYVTAGVPFVYQFYGKGKFLI